MANQQITPEMARRAGRFTLAKTFADVLYAVKVNLPPTEVGQRAEKFFDVLDSYIDLRVGDALVEAFQDVAKATKET